MIQHTIHKFAFIKNRSLTGELVVVWTSSSGVVFRGKELFQRVGAVVSYSGK